MLQQSHMNIRLLIGRCESEGNLHVAIYPTTQDSTKSSHTHTYTHFHTHMLHISTSGPYSLNPSISGAAYSGEPQGVLQRTRSCFFTQYSTLLIPNPAGYGNDELKHFNLLTKWNRLKLYDCFVSSLTDDFDVHFVI